MFTGKVGGLGYFSNYGMHVHDKPASGGVGDNDCNTTNGHFNPDGATHGSYHDEEGERHAGDLKMLHSLWDGTARYLYSDNLTSLKKSEASFIGDRSIVVHAMQDDLGRGGDDASLANGNSGPRISCCNIKIVDYETWKDADTDDYLPN